MKGSNWDDKCLRNNGIVKDKNGYEIPTIKQKDNPLDDESDTVAGINVTTPYQLQVSVYFSVDD